MNEIMNVNVNELACKELAQNLTVMSNTIKNCKANTWGYAYALHSIIKDKLYEEDYKDRQAFLNAYDMKKSSVSQMINAVDMAEYLKNSCGYSDILQYSVASVYVLHTYNVRVMKMYGYDDKEMNNWWSNAPIMVDMNRQEIVEALEAYINTDASDAIDADATEAADASEATDATEDTDYQKIVKWLDKCPFNLTDAMTETIMDMLGV